jgi:hypothetical protein
LTEASKLYASLGDVAGQAVVTDLLAQAQP